MTELLALSPANLPALHALLAARKAPLRFIAGGTDMLVEGRWAPEGGTLVDLSGVDGMACIDIRGGGIRIGAATTVAAIAGHRGLGERLAALCQAADEFASPQIRNRATIGGNIANSSPAADLVPVLLAAGARLVLLLPGGRRREVPLAAYAKAPGELIGEVIVPSANPTPASAFVKLGPRSALAISRLSLALVGRLEHGRFGVVRLAAGAIGPVARRLPLAEAVLCGRRLEAATLRDFLSALADEVDAAIPGRSSLPWKRRAVAGLGLDLIARFAGRSPREALFEAALA